MEYEQKTQEYDPIPIVIGVTGHRDIFCGTENDPEDSAALKEQVIASIKEIQALCGDTPVIMLNGLAQGADMFCAEIALDEEVNIPVYAVLPCRKDKYLQSFDSEAGRDADRDRARFNAILDKCSKVIIAPDQERLSKTVREEKFDRLESYEYRQLGIYIAEHSHFVMALWDGNDSKGQYGCGASDVVRFALTHNYLDSEHVPIPGTINDSAVIWINSRRKKTAALSARAEGCSDEIKRIYRIKDTDQFSVSDSGNIEIPYKDSDGCPDCIKEIVDRTVRYNNEQFSAASAGDYLWGDGSGKSVKIEDKDLNKLRGQYIKADSLASRYRDRYRQCMLWLAILSVCVAFSFLIYDDCSIPWMIFPCLAGLVTAIALSVMFAQKHKDYHRKYIEYRAFAEVLRIQFYLCACGTKSFICDEFSWSQKHDMNWIESAMRALFVTYTVNTALDKNEIKNRWITDQYKYHKSKLDRNKKNSHKHQAIISKKAQTALFVVSLVLYGAILLLEIFSLMNITAFSFWQGMFFDSPVSWRNVGAVAVGLSAVVTLFFSSYFENLANERKCDDHEKMKNLYIYALSNWDEIAPDKNRFERFVTSIAREEIIENGIWYSYVNDSGLQVNI